MIPAQLYQIDVGTLQTLCDDAVSESLTLEFKRELPGKELEQKSEFLKDISALANADGGDLVFGIEEKGGVARKLTSLSVISTDAESRRLGQILDAGIEPRITGVQFHWVILPLGNALVIRVPKSYDAPHRVTISGSRLDEKFFLRSGTHISTMSYEQLKTSFDRTATLTERAKAFRMERLSLILKGVTPKQVLPGPVCVAHVIPLSSASNKQVFDVIKLANQDQGKILFLPWQHNATTLNLDGIVAHTSTGSVDAEVYGYNQIFRNGCTESVCFASNVYQHGEQVIPATTVTFNLRFAVERNIALLKQYSISGPIIIGISMLSVKGYRLGLSSYDFMYRPAKPDREDLILPEVWIESLDLITNIDDIVRPLLDMLWQSFGVERCNEYSETGQWSPRNN